jgi:hypothetical protein
MFKFLKNKKEKEVNGETKEICISTEAIFVDEFVSGKRRESNVTKEMENTQQQQSQQQSPKEVSPDIV